MKTSQFLFKTSHLWALGELARGKDILKNADFLIVQRRAGMSDGHVSFHCTCQIRYL
jgi:hypothetical protein